MASGILRPAQKALLSDTVHELGELRALIARFAAGRELGAVKEDVEILNTAVRQLEQPFLLVVFGEFNSGKSALINALLDRELMKTGPLPTTDMIYWLQYGDHEETSSPHDGLVVIRVPSEFLRDIGIVDTPGTNSIIPEHERIALGFVPRADLVLFVTAIDRPLPDSERQFLDRIREWERKVIFVLSKIDQKNEGEIKEVQAFIETNVKKLLGFSPTVFPVAAAPALAAKQAGDRRALVQSRIEALETFIHSTLTEQERFRIKIMGTVNNGLRVSQKYVDAAKIKLDESKRNVVTVEQIQARLDRYDRDTSLELSPLLDRIADAAHELEKRGQAFVDKTIRVGNVAQLIGGQSSISPGRVRNFAANSPSAPFPPFAGSRPRETCRDGRPHVACTKPMASCKGWREAV